MAPWLSNRRHGPIGVDLGSRSVKLLQLSGDRTRVLEAVRWDLPARGAGESNDEDHARQVTEAIRQAREAYKFRGRDAVICLGAGELFVQNVRVPKGPTAELDRMVQQEAAGRLPFPIVEAELRYWHAADVRQGEVTKREIILLACHRPVLARWLGVVEAAGLRPVAVDVEPSALLRSYSRQFRRDEDRQQRAMYVHVGATSTVVVIARGEEILFVKYLEVNGRHMDEAVARHAKMTLSDALALRRNNGDRRVEQQDPEIARSVNESIRPVIDQLAGEIAKCARYHSVTFRGQPLLRLVLGGGEATPSLVDALALRVDLKCELGDPLRSFEATPPGGRKGQWDVACGLALRQWK